MLTLNTPPFITVSSSGEGSLVAVVVLVVVVVVAAVPTITSIIYDNEATGGVPCISHKESSRLNSRDGTAKVVVSWILVKIMLALVCWLVRPYFNS